MRRTHLAIAALCAIVIALVVWKLRSGSDDAGSGTAGGGNSDDPAMVGGRAGAGARGPTSTPAWLGGRITRASDGAGIAGAVVAVAHDQLVPMMRGEDVPSIVVTTDANGAWSIPTIGGGSYSIGATAAGFVPGSRTRIIVTSGSRTTIDLALAAGGNLVTGSVTDIGGGPIGGARVTAYRTTRNFTGGRAELVAITDAAGKYRLSLANGEYSATASHDDYTRVYKMFELNGVPTTLDFVLAPGSVIRGVVVSRDGKPVPGAKVRASSNRSFRDTGGHATADDKGVFTLTGLGSGAIKLTAFAKGFASNAPTVVELGIGEHVDGVKIIVDKALTISGRVVRAGKPAEGIPSVMLGVFSMGGGGNVLTSEPTDASGAFEIVGVKPASYMLFAIGEGFVPDIGKPVEVVDRDITDLVVELSTGVTLSGRVDPGAVASVGLEVDFEKVGIAGMFQAMKVMIVQGESDASGAFTLKSAPPGEYSIVASTAEGKKGKLDVVVTTTDQSGLVVKLEPRASIAGTVVDERGAPVGGVRVDTVLEDKGSGGSGMMRGSRRGETGSMTAANGTFKLVGLEPGKLGLIVADERGRIPWSAENGKDEPHKVELTKGQEMTGVSLTIEARDGVIKGLVLGQDKAPVPDAWVSVRPDRATAGRERRRDILMSFMQPADPILTGPDGTFTIQKLRRGTYEVTVEGPKGSSRANKTGVKTGETVTLVLEPLGTITGRVTAAGAPVTEFDLGCRAETRGVRFGGGGEDALGRRFTSIDGAYAVERLAPGEYTCTVSANGGTATGKVVVASGPVKLDLALSGFATITGLVVDAVTGKPLPGLMVIVAGEGIEGKAFMDVMAGKGPVTDASGRFTVERVPVGKGSVHVAPKDASFNHLASREYTATVGQRIDLGTIKLVPPKPDGGGTLGFFASVTEGNVMVVDVKSETPADKAGMLVGDKIVSIDGRPVTDIGADVAKQLVAPGTLAIGQRVQLVLEREGKQVPMALVAEKF